MILFLKIIKNKVLLMDEENSNDSFVIDPKNPDSKSKDPHRFRKHKAKYILVCLTVLILLLIIIILTLVLRSSSDEEKYLENLLKRELKMAENGVGIGMYVIFEDGDTADASIGFANKETEEVLTGKHRFRSASCSKTFTAVGILQLHENKKLSLDDTLHSWLPDIYIPNSRIITIRNLLQHTSGLGDYLHGPLGINRYFMSDRLHIYTPQDLLQIGVSQSPISSPSSSFSYSNTNYILLGLIIQKASNLNLSEYFELNIFEKAKLEGTYLGIADEMEIREPFCHGYTVYDGEFIDCTRLSPSVGWAAGAVITTPRDLASFASALQKGILINQNTMQEMMTFQDMMPGYQYGLGLMRADEDNAIGHTGAIAGFMSAFFCKKYYYCFAIYFNYPPITQLYDYLVVIKKVLTTGHEYY